MRSIVRSCRKRSSLTCKGKGISPTSSRNSVPPSASSILPGVVFTAPVKAPFSWPNSSLSSRFSGIAAQLIATKEPSLRTLESWTPRASSSLPAPLAPSSITDTLVGATLLDGARDLGHFGRGGDHRSQHGALVTDLFGQTAVFALYGAAGRRAGRSARACRYRPASGRNRRRPPRPRAGRFRAHRGPRRRSPSYRA